MRTDSQNLLDAIAKGDSPGHAFRGNQYSGSTGSHSEAAARLIAEHKGLIGPAEYAVGQSIRATTTAQGMKEGSEYKVTDVRVQDLPFGTYVSYELDHRLWIGNAQLLTEPAGDERPGMFRAKKGDLPGHPFRGNQHTQGQGGGGSKDGDSGKGGKTVGDITIKNGAVTQGGKKVGTLNWEHQFGYHPVAVLRLGGQLVRAYETDTPKLVDRAFADAKAHLEGKSLKVRDRFDEMADKPRGLKGIPLSDEERADIARLKDVK